VTGWPPTSRRPSPSKSNGVARDVASDATARDVSIELAIAGAVDLAHPTGTKGRKNLVSAEMSAGGKGRGCPDLRKNNSAVKTKRTTYEKLMIVLSQTRPRKIVRSGSRLPTDELCTHSGSTT